MIRKRADESQIEQESQNPIQNEVPGLVAVWDVINDSKNPQLSLVSQNNNKQDKEGKE